MAKNPRPINMPIGRWVRDRWDVDVMGEIFNLVLNLSQKTPTCWNKGSSIKLKLSSDKSIITPFKQAELSHHIDI
jgi:hypothetical protein